ncbi:unnamed protein product, partial [Hapterophycus canaliculatus]
MERRRNGSIIPEPDGNLCNSCSSSGISSAGGGLNEDVGHLSAVTGLARLDPPKELGLSQIRRYEAKSMVTSTLTRAEHHTEKRRIMTRRSGSMSKGDL